MYGNSKDLSEIKERRWEYDGGDTYIRRAFKRNDGTTVLRYRKARWYNKWFLTLMNRNRTKDRRTVQKMMDDAGVLSMSSPNSNVTYVNTQLIQEKRKRENN